MVGFHVVGFELEREKAVVDAGVVGVELYPRESPVRVEVRVGGVFGYGARVEDFSVFIVAFFERTGEC